MVLLTATCNYPLPPRVRNLNFGQKAVFFVLRVQDKIQHSDMIFRAKFWCFNPGKTRGSDMLQFARPQHCQICTSQHSAPKIQDRRTEEQNKEQQCRNLITPFSIFSHLYWLLRSFLQCYMSVLVVSTRKKIMFQVVICDTGIRINRSADVYVSTGQDFSSVVFQCHLRRQHRVFKKDLGNLQEE